MEIKRYLQTFHEQKEATMFSKQTTTAHYPLSSEIWGRLPVLRTSEVPDRHSKEFKGWSLVQELS